MTPSETPRKKDDRYGYFTYDELKEHLGLPDKAVILLADSAAYLRSAVPKRGVPPFFRVMEA